MEFGKLRLIQKEKQVEESKDNEKTIKLKFQKMHNILIECTINPSNQMN